MSLEQLITKPNGFLVIVSKERTRYFASLGLTVSVFLPHFFYGELKLLVPFLWYTFYQVHIYGYYGFLELG